MKIKIFALITMITTAAVFYADAPCATPPFLSQSMPANVLIIFDNSGSMTWNAYDEGNCSYWSDSDFNKDRYGYAENDMKYSYNYSEDYWEEDPTASVTAFNPRTGKITGRFYNWITTKRVDVARKVLVGGKIADRSATPMIRVQADYGGSYSDSYYDQYWWNYDLYDDGCKWKFVTRDDEIRCYLPEGWDCRRYISSYDLFNDWPNYRFEARIEVPADDDGRGFLQRTQGTVQYGLEIFHSSEGGWFPVFIGGSADSIRKVIESDHTQSNTPLAEVLYEAYLMFSAQPSCHNYCRCYDMQYFNTYCGASLWGDREWIDYADHDPMSDWCEKNFIIYITDGEPTSDGTIPNWIKDEYNGGGSSYYLDDVAYYMRTHDIRDDYAGKQNVMMYAVFTFGNDLSHWGPQLLMEACKAGGFDDLNNNHLPDLQAEWDKDNDNMPDNFFFATSGEEIEMALNATFSDILKRTSSASAVSVVSASSRGEGTVYQALFAPVKFMGDGEIDWMGQLRSLWIDQMGNLREDTQDDETLHMINDRIISVSFDGEATVATKYRDLDGDGVEDGEIETINADSVAAVWDAGKHLWRRNPDGRSIYVSQPTASGWQKMQFTTSNSDSFYVMLDVPSEASADTLIEWVRGTDFSRKRSRTSGGDVWKLGDIIYSTPVYVGAPRDRYDLIYNDVSYQQYFQTHHARRGVVYQGANDGMLHAFNAGRYNESSDAIERGSLDDKGTYDLGEEIWGIIPYSLMPHLKWQTLAGYGSDCHVYYVDNKIKSFDAKIFTADDTHTNGWGTIVLATQRLGGMPVTLSNGQTLHSSMLAVDVTTPESPDIMWEWNDVNLGLTTVYPAIATMEGEWFVLYGSGPTDVTGDVTQYGRVYVLALEDADIEKQWTISDDTHMGDPLMIDINYDRNTDVAYMGTCQHDHTWANWEGEILRINFFESADPADWQVSTLIDLQRPFSSAGGGTIDPYGNLWYFAGSGHYLSDYDEIDESTQYFIGLKDSDWSSGSTEYTLSDLVDVTDVEIYQTDTGAVVTGLPEGNITFNELKYKINQEQGWYIEFTDGERILDAPLVIGETVFFTTFEPNEDVCSFGGISRLYGVNYTTGTANPSLNTMGRDGLLYQTNLVLGEGVPTSPAAHIGISDDATIATQLSTGEISMEKAHVQSVKSGPIFWKTR